MGVLSPAVDDGAVPVSPVEAITILERFLHMDREESQRGEALNDPRVPDHTVAAFIRTLEDEQLLAALVRCLRPGVLALWAIDSDARMRRRVALNWATSVETLRVLAGDDDELVRTFVALNPGADFDTRAWLLADPSPEVRESVLEIEEACSTASENEDEDDEPGDDNMLAFLHEFVPAAEELDCSEELDWERRHAQADALERDRNRWLGLDQPEYDSDEEGQDEEPSPRITEAQALALLRYYLGALEITPPADDTDES